MNRRIALLLIGLLAVVGAAACTKKGTTSQRASSLATNATVQADKAQAEKIVQGCMPANYFTLRSKAARKNLLDCLAPAQNKGPFETCASQALVAGKKAKIEAALTTCVEKYSGKKGTTK